MAKIVFCVVFCALFSFSLQESGSLVCNSDKLSKCDCEQKTDPFEQIPLFKVDCSRLNFEDIPSSNFLPLYTGYLDLSHNKIPSLDDSSKLFSTTLNHLDLSYNKINSISDKYFQNLTQLIRLNLGHNTLTTLPNDLFYGLANLKTLNLRSNEITTVTQQLFLPLSALEELILNNNKLGEFLEPSKLSNYLPKSLRSLHLDHVRLKNVSRQLFEDIPLKRLSIAYNPFSELPYLPLNNLEYLDISGSKISNITTKSLMFPYLKVLKMNRLHFITKIYDYTFFNLHKLEELYIEHCTRLEEMEPISFGYLQDKDSSNYLSVRKISVAYSGLKFLPATFQFVFQNLEEIHLRGNFWDCSCKLMWFTHLKKNVKDVDEIRCFSPESQANKTIHSMTEEEFSCFEVKKITATPPGAPTQNWLFPLVGVLGIIIFILIAVLIYMGPYGQNIYKMEGKMIGPDSPYNPVTIYPNQAEDFKI